MKSQFFYSKSSTQGHNINSSIKIRKKDRMIRYIFFFSIVLLLKVKIVLTTKSFIKRKNSCQYSYHIDKWLQLVLI